MEPWGAPSSMKGTEFSERTNSFAAAFSGLHRLGENSMDTTSQTPGGGWVTTRIKKGKEQGRSSLGLTRVPDWKKRVVITILPINNTGQVDKG